MGHRLTIAITAWRAEVRWSADEPASVELTADVGSLEVTRGEGKVTGLSGPEKALARANALKSLSADRFPHIRFPVGVSLDGLFDRKILSRQPGVVLMQMVAPGAHDERLHERRLVLDAAELPPLRSPALRWRDRPSTAMAARNVASFSGVTPGRR